MVAEKNKANWMKEMMEQARQFDTTVLSADERRQLKLITTDSKPAEPELVE